MSSIKVLLSLDGKSYIDPVRAPFTRYVGGVRYMTEETPQDYHERMMECERQNAFNPQPILIEVDIDGQVLGGVPTMPNIKESTQMDEPTPVAAYSTSTRTGEQVTAYNTIAYHISQTNYLSYMIETKGIEFKRIWLENRRLVADLEAALTTIKLQTTQGLKIVSDESSSTETLLGILEVNEISKETDRDLIPSEESVDVKVLAETADPSELESNAMAKSVLSADETNEGSSLPTEAHAAEAVAACSESVSATCIKTEQAIGQVLVSILILGRYCRFS
jgi:hypothetical protein